MLWTTRWSVPVGLISMCRLELTQHPVSVTCSSLSQLLTCSILALPMQATYSQTLSQDQLQRKAKQTRPEDTWGKMLMTSCHGGEWGLGERMKGAGGVGHVFRAPLILWFTFMNGALSTQPEYWEGKTWRAVVKTISWAQPTSKPWFLSTPLHSKGYRAALWAILTAPHIRA